jgi:uncharacterized protein (DUF608 family)
VRASLDYCIRSWDPRRAGWLEEPQHNTYDTWFWGPNSLCTSLYLGALQAAVQMGTAVRDDVAGYADLHQRGMQKIGALFDGEYFAQRIEWRGLKARFPEFNLAALSSLPNQQMAAFLSEILTAPESMKISEREGPPSQYGSGCLADGVMGAWMAWVCGIGNLLDSVKVASHLQAVYRHNFKRELSAQANPFRSSFACGGEGGLLLCTWPKGDAPSLPMEYSGEVWSGIEYQVASHMMAHGMVKEGLEIVRTARARYDGRVRNPFDEIEAGHWYARAMSSYALLQAYSGVRYDAVDKILYMKPAVAGDFRSFLATATGYGMVGVRGGKPFVDVARGEILCSRIEYSPA